MAGDKPPDRDEDERRQRRKPRITSQLRIIGRIGHENNKRKTAATFTGHSGYS